MHCTNCGASTPEYAPFCARCGQAQPSTESGRLDLPASAWEVLGWILVEIVASLVIVPLAWVFAAVSRWFCRNLKFSDGTTARFHGTGGQVVGWVILYVLTHVVLRLSVHLGSEIWLTIAIPLMMAVPILVVAAAIKLQILRWWISNVELGSGTRLEFRGTYVEYLGWSVLVAISVLTIVGWAWAEAAQKRWIARNVYGPGIEFRFHGEGHQVLWRTVVCFLGCIPIIPIPWMVLWLLRWYVKNVSITRRTVAAAAA